MIPRTKWKFTMFLAVSLCCAASYAAPILYEPFDFYGDYVENFTNGTHITEMPGSLKKMVLRPEKPNHNALKKPFAIPADRQTGNFKYTFRVKFDDEKRALSAHMLFSCKDEKGTVKDNQKLMAQIDWEKGSSFHGLSTRTHNPVIQTRNKGKFAYQPSRYWANVEIRAFQGSVSIWIERDGKMTFETATRIPENAVLTGLNFSSAGTITLDDLKVEDYNPSEPMIPLNGLDLPVPEDGLRFTMRTMVPYASLTMTMDTGSEKPAVYTLRSVAQRYNKPEAKGNTTQILHDNILDIRGPGAVYPIYTRPVLEWFYMPDQIPTLRANWDHLGEDVADHTFEFQIVGNQLWIDGSFYCNIPGDGPVKSVKIGSGYPFTEIKTQSGIKEYEDGLKVNVPLPWAFKDYFPTALCQENYGTYMLECDGYLTRSPFGGMQDCYLRAVPTAQYHKAIVTYSMDSDTEKSTDLTVRLTRFKYGGGRSPMAMASKTVTLPRIKEGKIKTVELDIPIGNIQDIVFMENKESMDVEVLGGLYEKNHYYMSRYNKPALKRSSVRVHGLQLIKSPATLMVKNGILGNLFYTYEDVHVTAVMSALKAGTYTLEWQVKDADGNMIETVSEKIKFKKAGEKQEIKIPFKEKSVGYYDYTVSLKKGKESLVTYNGSYVCIPPDTRKAGYESPYYQWIFKGAHGSLSKKEDWGELLKRFGIRRTLLGKYSEEDTKEYKLLQGQHPYGRVSGSIEDYAKECIEKSPHATQAIIFHESGGGPFPLELIGGKTVITPEQERRDQERQKTALKWAKAWRKTAPHIQLVIGNSGESIGLIAQLFRQKFPRELIDKMGEESVGLTLPPEMSTAGPYWRLKELARIYGYKDLMPEACYEWKCRSPRFDTPGTDFPSRDRLIAMAWGNKLVPIGMESEYCNSYYNTIWCAGEFSRNPLLQPSRRALTNCIFTQVFDQVEFKRMIPTGSLTAYVLEFKRSDGKFVYAMWSARGTVNAAIKFPAGTQATHITTLGKEKACTAAESLGSIPIYVVSDKALESVQVAMTRTFENEPGNIEKAVVAAPMDKAEDWTLVEGEDKRIIPPDYNQYFRRPGKFTLAGVKDEEKGDCLEVKLIPEGDCPDLIQEYAFIRLKNPVELAGTPDTVGVWVKGNSSWGKIFLELEDADGDIWLSAGTGGYGCDSYDWPSLMSLNYDGWHFLQMPLTAKSPVKIHSPGDNEWQWQRERIGDGALTYPLKVRGIGFLMGRKTLNILDMEDVKNLSIRFKDFSSY